MSMFWEFYSATFVVYKLKDNIMNYKTISKKVKSAVLWIYKSFTNKFTGAYKKLKDRFPVLDKYPMLKYALIPILLGILFLIRYFAKIGMNELAAWGSNSLAETSGFAISERVIVLSVAAAFVAFRVVVLFRKRNNDKDKQTSVEL
jgi:hypothetical protein